MLALRRLFRQIDEDCEFELTTPAVIPCILVSIGLALAWRSLLQLGQFIGATTLLSAWRWAVSAAILWSLTWFLDDGTRLLSNSTADHLWYASAVVALCPAIAVLGSRRPGTRVWTAFIQFPMLLVLGWPVIALVLQGHEIRGLQLETPQLAAYLLVLLMGAGNYIGTRFTFPSLCYGTALGLIALTSSAVAPQFIADRWSSRIWASGLILLALLSAARSSTHPAANSDRFDRLWLDFFDQFGVVWGRRIQDRVNHIAARENWPGHLELHGFEWTSSPDPTITLRLEHTFRWLLRRFVDPEWINERLGTKSEDGQIAAMTTDS